MSEPEPVVADLHRRLRAAGVSVTALDLDALEAQHRSEHPWGCNTLALIAAARERDALREALDRHLPQPDRDAELYCLGCDCLKAASGLVQRADLGGNKR